jgi:sortase A
MVAQQQLEVDMKRIVLFLLLFASAGLIVNGYWIPIKAELAQHLLLRAWKQSKLTGKVIKPWPWADSWPVGRLRQQRLGVDLIVLEGQSGEVLAFGPGHLSQSGRPGTRGHIILAGHRDTSFEFLRDLHPGDSIEMEGLTATLRYLVSSTEVAVAEALYLDRDAMDQLTLITCYPFDRLLPGGTLRYIVMAQVIS